MSALRKLQDEFSIDLAVGTLMLATTPTVVKRVMQLEEAEAYYYALTDIGLEIELHKDQSVATPTVVGHTAPQEHRKSLTRGLTLLLDFDGQTEHAQCYFPRVCHALSRFRHQMAAHLRNLRCHHARNYRIDGIAFHIRCRRSASMDRRALRRPHHWCAVWSFWRVLAASVFGPL